MRVLITFPPSAESEATNVEALAEATKCCSVIDVIKSVDMKGVSCGDYDVILVLIGAGSFDPSFESKIEECAKAGVLVVGVWTTASPVKKVPEMLEDLGSGEITQTKEDIAAVVCNQKPIWKTPEGDLRPDRPLERNKCR